MQQDDRVCGSVLWMEAPGPKLNAIVGFDRYGFEATLLSATLRSRDSSSDASARRAGCSAPSATKTPITADAAQYPQRRNKRQNNFREPRMCVSFDRYGESGRRVPVRRDLCALRGLNLSFGFTQDLRPGLLSAAPAGAVSCSADRRHNPSGCGDPSPRARAPASHNGQHPRTECPRHRALAAWQTRRLAAAREILHPAEAGFRMTSVCSGDSVARFRLTMIEVGCLLGR